MRGGRATYRRQRQESRDMLLVFWVLRVILRLLYSRARHAGDIIGAGTVKEVGDCYKELTQRVFAEDVPKEYE